MKHIYAGVNQHHHTSLYNVQITFWEKKCYLLFRLTRLKLVYCVPLKSNDTLHIQHNVHSRKHTLHMCLSLCACTL